MNMKTLLIPLIFIVLLSGNAMAINNSTIVFRQSSLTIMSEREVIVETTDDINDDENKKDKKSDSKGSNKIEEPKTTVQTVAYPFKVNLRRQRLKNQEWLQHQINIKPDRGLLIQIEPSDAISLEYSDIYKAVDILLIRPTGVIDAIMPKTIPMNIGETIVTNTPISAILYLHSGICEELGIIPGNNVKHDIFQPKATILRGSK